MISRPLKIFGLIVGGMVILGLWIFLAPTKLGGSTTYSITDGVSMQPLLYKNDLALVRAQSSYHVGEIVLYQSQVLHRPVLHRIILIQDGNYFFKGDNNSFVDPGYATRSELIGKLWIHIPEAGAVLGWFGKPMHAALLAGSATMVLVLTGFTTTEHRKHRRKATAAHKRWLGHSLIHRKLTAVSPPVLAMAEHSVPAPPSSVALAQAPSYFEGSTPTLLTLGILLTLAILFLIVGFSHPSRHVAPLADAYQQTGDFSYSAAVKAPTIVYPSGFITTGQPIYPSLVNTVSLHFGYHFTSGLRHTVKGTVEIRETLKSDSDSWQQVSTLKSSTVFAGDSVSISSVLPLNNLYRLIANISAQSGNTGVDYVANVQPMVHITGTVGGKAINETFAPVLPFTIGQTTASIVATDSPLPAGATYVAPSASSELASTLHPIQLGSIPQPVTNSIPVAKYKISVPLIRLAGLIFSTLALLVALIHDTLRRRQRIGSADELIEQQFESLVIPVASVGNPSGVTLIAIPKFAELARLAQYLERPILCQTSNGNRTYVVDDETDRYITYSSQVTTAPPSTIVLKTVSELPKQALAASASRPRIWLLLIRGGAILLVFVVVATLTISFTASTNVPASHVGVLVSVPGISEFVPTACDSLTLTSYVVGSGTFSNSLSHVIIIGSAGVDTITDHGSGNCIIGGGGKDKVTAPSTDICIIGPTTGATYGSCKTAT